MAYEEKRALVEIVFGGNTLDGRRMGVYIERGEGDDWKFSIHGHLIDEEGLAPMSDNAKKAYFGDSDSGGYNMHVHKELVTKSALY